MKYLLIFLRKSILNVIFFKGIAYDFLEMYEKYQVIVFVEVKLIKNHFF